MIWLPEWIRVRLGGREPSDSDVEKRRYPRVKAYNTLKQIGYDIDNFPMITQITDISEGGIQFTSQQTFHADDILQLVLEIAEKDQEVFFLGKIAWSRQDREQKDIFRIGLSFLEMAQSDRLIVRNYVRELEDMGKRAA